MSTRQKATVKNPKAAISSYPDLEFRPHLAQLAAEMLQTEGKLLVECARAVFEMVAADEPEIPKIVTLLRTIRRNDATMMDPPRKFKKRQGGQRLESLD